MRLVVAILLGTYIFVVIYGKKHKLHRDSTSEVDSSEDSYDSDSDLDEESEESSSSEDSSTSEEISSRRQNVNHHKNHHNNNHHNLNNNMKLKNSNTNNLKLKTFNKSVPKPTKMVNNKKYATSKKISPKRSLHSFRKSHDTKRQNHNSIVDNNHHKGFKNAYNQNDEVYDSLENFNDESDNTQVEDVKITFVVFRHGLTAPNDKEIKQYTNFKVQESFEADLTATGRNQSHHVGLYLRNRYAKLLSKIYTAKEIQVRTIDNDLVKTSILIALAALYPALGERRNDPLLLQAVPYDSLTLEEDDLRAYENCPKYKRMREETIALPPVIEKLMKLDSSMDLLKEITGKYYNITDLYTLARIYNIMFMFQEYEVNRLTFTFAEVAMKEIARMSFWTQFYNSSLIRFATGVMMNEIIEAIDLIHDNVTSLKMYLVAGTDFNVAAWLAAAKVFAVHQPEPGSIFCLEIYYSDEHKDFGVRAVYKPEPDVENKILQIRGCENNGYCSTKEFKKLCQKYVMSEAQYRRECRELNRKA